MRDRFCRLRLREAVIHCPVEVIGHLRDLACCDQCAHRYETAIPRREIRTQPKIAEQNVSGVLDDARKSRPELTADASGPVRFRRFVEREKRGRSKRKLIIRMLRSAKTSFATATADIAATVR